MAGPLKMPRNSSSHVDTMVIVSSAATHRTDITKCALATGPFSGLSCKDAFGYCAGPGQSFGEHAAMDHYETCYVSNNDPPNDRCWSRSHKVKNCKKYSGVKVCFADSERCDPVGYFDGDDGYDIFGVWHVQTPLPDGSCGNPCREFK